MTVLIRSPRALPVVLDIGPTVVVAQLTGVVVDPDDLTGILDDPDDLTGVVDDCA